MRRKILFLNITIIVTILIFILFGGLFTIQVITSSNKELFYTDGIYLALVIVWLIEILIMYIAFNLEKLLKQIANEKLFSDYALMLFKKIKFTILTIGIASIGFMSMFFHVARGAEAPGVVLFGLGIVFIPFAIFVFCEVLESILKSAIKIKQDNDLTI